MSGIYIPDIQPPKDEAGAFKPIIMYVGADGKIRAECEGTHEVTVLPDHGRLIDAEVFSRALCNDEYQDGLHILNQMPTIIPADKEAGDG